MAKDHGKNPKSVPELPPESPIYLGPVSNGEYFPPLDPRHARAENLIHRIAADYAPKLGQSRREFLKSACGMAAALMSINLVSGCAGDGGYQVDEKMLCDPSAAGAALSGNEFIFDVQTHHFNAAEGAAWMQNKAYYTFLSLLAGLKESGYEERGEALPPFSAGSDEHLRMLSRDTYIYEMFLASDTTLAVLTGIPATNEANPLTNHEIAESRDIINCVAGMSQRVLNHAMVLPNLTADPEAQFDAMRRTLEDVKTVAGWKSYTAWGPNGRGYFFDSDVGERFLDFVRQSGKPLVCVHKGLPIPTFDDEHNDPRDIGPAAKNFPDVNILVYHAGYSPEVTEGPYDPALPMAEQVGINRLLKSLQESGIGPNKNVYAELGSTWSMVMKDAVQAQHVIGKLLKYVGEDRVVWGTDSIWYGSPQPQIEAFRALEISTELQETYGYPALTKQRKAKIFGLNAAKVYGINPAETRNAIKENFQMKLLKASVDEMGAPRPMVYGPRSRRDVLKLLLAHRGLPG